MTAQALIPPDLARCQAEITTHRPFVMGGITRVVERCTAAPAVIATEINPGPDGQRGSMSLCAPCMEVARKTLGPGFVEFKPIPKKFAGHRNYEQIREACRAQGLILEDVDYRRHGSDWIGVRGKPGGTLVLYSTPTGRFHGTHPDTGEKFTESSPLDGKPWFDALLSFFFYEEGPARIRRSA